MRAARCLFSLLLLVLPMTLPAQGEDAALAHARRLLADRPIIDGHNDLPWEIRSAPRA